MPITSETVEDPAAKVLLDSVAVSDLLVLGTPAGHGAFVGVLLGSGQPSRRRAGILPGSRRAMIIDHRGTHAS